MKILVAHDLDVAGIRIFGTLGSDSNRYQFRDKPDIHRLGLTFEQADAMHLQAERQENQGEHRRVLEGLKAHGASNDELAFIAGGSRVELNAMPSDQFIDWIEQGLIKNGVRKVIPSPEIIEAHARQLLGLRHLSQHVAELEQAAREHAAGAQLPDDLAERIRDGFERDSTLPWEDALGAAVAGMVGDE